MRKLAALALALSFILGGCGPQLSAPDSKDIPIEKREKTLVDYGWNKVVESVQKSQAITKYGISGTLDTREQNKFHRSAIYGNVVPPDQMDLSQQVDGRSYYLFQDKTSTFYREEGVWKPIDRVTIPDVWSSLQRLTKIKPSQVYRLKDISMFLPNDTELYQFEADAIDLLGAPAPQGKKLPSLYTIYIDTKTRYIREIDIKTTSAVDDVGTVVTDAAIKFFSQSADTKAADSVLKRPPSLEQQLKNQKQ